MEIMWRDTNKKHNGHSIFENDDGRLKYVENIDGDDFIVTTRRPNANGVYRYTGPVLVTDPSKTLKLAGWVTKAELGM